MRFDLPEDEVRFDPRSRRVRLDLDRFNALIAYVECLEDRLDPDSGDGADSGSPLRVARSEAGSVRIPPEPDRGVAEERNLLAPAELGRLAEFARMFRQPDGLRPRLRRHRISIQRLSELTRVPYTTLYRYVSGQAPPIDTASEILHAIAWASPTLRAEGFESATDEDSIDRV